MSEDWLLNVISLVGILAWPTVVLVLILSFRNSIIGVLNSLKSFKFRDFELKLIRKSESARVKATANPTSFQVSISPAIKKPHDNEVEESTLKPREAIQDAWSRLENTATGKFRELSRRKDRDLVNPYDAVAFFEFSSALTPSSEESLRELRWLQYQLAHPLDDYVTAEIALNFVEAANSLIAQIDAMSDTPAVDLGLFIHLIQQYSKLIDKGIGDDITVSNVIDRIADGTILRFIQERAESAGDSIDLNLLLNVTADEQSFEAYYVKCLQAFAEVLSTKGIDNNGLCLLIAWTSHIIGRGGGWVPSDNIAGLHEE